MINRCQQLFWGADMLGVSYKSRQQNRGRNHYVSIFEFDGSVNSGLAIKRALGPAIDYRPRMDFVGVNGERCNPGDYVLRFSSGWCDVIKKNDLDALYERVIIEASEKGAPNV